ncbi:MAG: arginine--tRNA ligase [Candidatus Omnitrophota bacterium]
MNINNEIISLLKQAVDNAAKEFNFKEIPAAELEIPQIAKFGDLSTNIAMQLCKANRGAKPIAIASFIHEDLNKRISKSPLSDYVKEISVEQPGFINFFLSDRAFYEILHRIDHEVKNFGRPLAPVNGKKAIIEFVSANPTGPLTVAHARQAVVGNALSNILEFFGWNVYKEYYLNDEGNQINLLGASIYARYAELAGPACRQAGLHFEFPQDGYKGDYIKDIAKEIYDKHGDKFKAYNEKEKTFFSDYGINCILATIKKDLSNIGVVFDNYASQAVLAKSGKIEKILSFLKENRLSYEKEGATWFKSTDFADDKDRVLIKSDGSYTYITPDIAYHKDKYDRGFDWLIDIWGPDHHGYIPRMKAAQRALGKKDHTLSILIVQLATIYKAGKPLRMSTRAGEFITLREVIDEVGPDVAKVCFLMRKISSHLDFDLELAKSQSLENPVYYIQYAHARICGILEHSKKAVSGAANKPDPKLLKEKEELDILKKLREYPDILYAAYNTLEPYRVLDYLLQLAALFHSFYSIHRVVTEDNELTQTRLFLVKCIKTTISNALEVLGISVPEKM